MPGLSCRWSPVLELMLGGLALASQIALVLVVRWHHNEVRRLTNMLVSQNPGEFRQLQQASAPNMRVPTARGGVPNPESAKPFGL